MKNNNTLLINRRHSLILSAASLISLKSKLVWSQDYTKYKTDLTPIFSEALSIRNFSVSIHPAEIESAISEFIKQDYNARRKSLAVANQLPIFASYSTSKDYVTAILDLLPGNFPIQYDDETKKSLIAVISELDTENFPVAPEPKWVAPARIPTIEPYNPTNDDIIVAGDIVLETLGISFAGKSLIISFVESDSQIMEAFNNLVKSISTKDWNEVIDISENIFRLFIGSQFWADLKNEISKKNARRITFGFAARCVPIVGWIYLGAAFLISVKHNYHRFSFA